jgi:hypothetical protein
MCICVYVCVRVYAYVYDAYLCACMCVSVSACVCMCVCFHVMSCVCVHPGRATNSATTRDATCARTSYQRALTGAQVFESGAVNLTSKQVSWLKPYEFDRRSGIWTQAL